MLLAAIFSWFVVLTDCNGGPAVISKYLIDVAHKEVVAVVACPSPEDPEALCPVYSSFSPVRVGEVPQPPGAVAGQELSTPVPDCTPGIGGVCYWINTPVDQFGRKSGEVCR